MKHLLLFFTIFFFCAHSKAQQKDTALARPDTILVQPPVVNHYEMAWQQLMQQNAFLNTAATPLAMPVKFKPAAPGNIFFYLLLILVFMLALLRFFYARYFSTLFRVFFNTSLRQSQLTDQLLQAKLPSMLFNFFFVISAGSYVYFLLRQYLEVPENKQWIIWGGSIAALALIYAVKYSTLKLTGWATGFSSTTNSYVFVIFLINKILGVLLLPFTVLMAFADLKIAAIAALISLLLAGLLLLMRFFRSYGLLQNQLKINRFHFFLYLVGVEIIPLLLIYKTLMILLPKNL